MPKIIARPSAIYANPAKALSLIYASRAPLGPRLYPAKNYQADFGLHSL